MEQFYENEETEFEYEWLTREKYQFKLLALLAVLADNHLAYRGTLTDMCEFLGVTSRNSRTNQKIMEAISVLEADGLLKKITDGRTYTLTLSKKAEKERRVIRIQKKWVVFAKNYSQLPNKSVSIDWVPLLKVWLYLIDNNSTLTTTKEIAAALGLSEGTVKNARIALEKDIEAIVSQKKFEYNSKLEHLYRCIGSEIRATAWITESRSTP